jgi:hypothetical protein
LSPTPRRERGISIMHVACVDWDLPLPSMPLSKQCAWTRRARYIYPNGSALLIYKGGRAPGWPGMYQGVAFAEHYTGPYKRLVNSSYHPLVLPTNCEDPGVMWDPDLETFRMILHCACETQQMWSTDGLSWQKSGPEQKDGWCSGFNYTGGGSEGDLMTRQRPKWVLERKTGRATHLTTGVNRPGDSGMGHTWTMAAKLKSDDDDAPSLRV